MKPAQLPDRVLLFDGVCNLCSGAVQFIIKRDPAGKISFASLQSDTARELLASEGLPTEQFDSMIFIENGRIYKKSAAVLKVSRHLRGAWRLSAVFSQCPAPSGTEPILSSPGAVTNGSEKGKHACSPPLRSKTDFCLNKNG